MIKLRMKIHHILFFCFVSAVATTSTSTGSTPETPPGSLEQGYFILILMVCASVFALLLVVVLLLLLYKLKMKRSSADLNTRGNPNAGDKKISTDETCPPVSTCEDSVYQSLDLASRDQAQIYSTLTCTPHTYCNKPLQ
uniref:uncharacterized protein LOC109970986 isoform X2 n=1 Tax=Monopterus albus TaxID=43700 RepID=UPI0009B468F6|nr:uncharacterized protein LOC109970986 isoform X2 [Monopterus albus]